MCHLPHGKVMLHQETWQRLWLQTAVSWRFDGEQVKKPWFSLWTVRPGHGLRMEQEKACGRPEGRTESGKALFLKLEMENTGSIVVPNFREVRSEDLNFQCERSARCALSQAHSAPGQVQVNKELGLSWFVFTQQVQWKEGGKGIDGVWWALNLRRAGRDGVQGRKGLWEPDVFTGTLARQFWTESSIMGSERSESRIIANKMSEVEWLFKMQDHGSRGRVKVIGGGDVKEWRPRNGKNNSCLACNMFKNRQNPCAVFQQNSEYGEGGKDKIKNIKNKKMKEIKTKLYELQCIITDTLPSPAPNFCI